MKAILKKELRSYFLSPLGYVFMGVFLFINAMFFINGAVAYGVANVKVLYSNVNILFLFLISILTMRLLSEEKNKKTDRLLLTAPISVTELVLGKYLSAVCVFLITLAVSMVFPITLFIFGNPPIGELIGGYIGFILLWASLISVGVFISALTESQMVAAVLTFAALLFLDLMDGAKASISNTVLVKIISALSVFGRFGEIQNGILNIANVIYYLSFIFVFLFLTVKVIDRKRYS